MRIPTIKYQNPPITAISHPDVYRMFHRRFDRHAFLAIIRLRKMTVEGFAKEIKAKTATVESWMIYGCKPAVKQFPKICAVLNCNVSAFARKLEETPIPVAKEMLPKPRTEARARYFQKGRA